MTARFSWNQRNARSQTAPTAHSPLLGRRFPWHPRNVLQSPLLMSGLFQSSGEMLSHTNRVGHCGKRGVHRPDADEEAGVDHIQIVELMRFAVDIENRTFRVATETTGPGLMSHTSDGDFGLEICIARNQMVRFHSQVRQHRFELVVELLLWDLVVWCVA